MRRKYPYARYVCGHIEEDDTTMNEGETSWCTICKDQRMIEARLVERKIEWRRRPTIVCLCGSTRFSDAFHEANLRETLAGNIVLSIGCDFKSDRDLELAGELTPEDKVRLDELHLRKIDLADEVLILNVKGYIGASTRRELEYAHNHGKIIRYLEP